MPGIILDTGDSAVNKIDTNLCLQGACILVKGER